MTTARLGDEEYRALATFRTELRRFLAFSERVARDAGLTPQQHQMLLAVRGHPGPGPASVSDVAAALLLRRHSATELVNRAAEAGLVVRTEDADDARRTLVVLTPAGEEVLDALSDLHRAELPRLRAVVAGLDALDQG
ncbi:MAG TPA: MarR family winged helix-turn-helix transcriptional regulator [Iamia sp.]|nr:MarR family winged helix-turn-helix transcriptional regulator [Iamia sp.]